MVKTPESYAPIRELVQQALLQVPDYKRFLTVSEMDASSADLARRYPGRVALTQVGLSTDGHPIQALVIGKTKPGPGLPLPDGTEAALLFGCPHPNEPIGAMMLEFVSVFLAEHPEIVERMGYTWYLIKCVDPDGTKLNEGWFPGPFTITNYATNFYRPAGHEQVEWTFPIDYKTLRFDRPIPETQSLMSIIDQVKPKFMYSLHNAGFGGVYFYMSRAAEGLYASLHEAALEQDLPLNRGEPEVPYAVTLADAVYKMPSSKESYDWLAEHSGKDPADILGSGTSSDDYARRIRPDTFSLVCEMPYFYHPSVTDLEPTEVKRRAAVLDNHARDEVAMRWLRDEFTALRDLLATPSRFRTAVSTFLERWEGHSVAQRQWAETSPELERPATRAELFSNRQMPEFYRLLMLGMAVRMIRAEMDACAGTPRDEAALTRLIEAEAKLSERLAAMCAAAESNIQYDVIPIRKLVSVQLASALYTAEYLWGCR